MVLFLVFIVLFSVFYTELQIVNLHCYHLSR